MIIRINYMGTAGVPQFVDLVEPGQPLEGMLESIGRTTATGGLYTVMDNGTHVVSIPGRRIETVEVRE